VGQCQCDGCPAEYKWRSLLNAAVWLTPTSRVPCERLGRKLNFAPGKIPQPSKIPQNVYIVSSPGDGQRSCKVWLSPVERQRCSNEATRNPLKFAGMSQTHEPISTDSGPKLTTLCTGMWGRYCCLTSFFFRLSTCAFSCEDMPEQVAS